MSDRDLAGFVANAGKVQPPLLPRETLERERLLAWLGAKIHSRLVLVVADAGHGKTTLLADWTRRTRVRTLWYRLDESDRDWVVFIDHVIAAGREIDPGFATGTTSLVRELGAGIGDRKAILRSLLAEIRSWTVAPTALVLDDYQAVDDVPEIRDIVRELLLQGPDRLSLVVSSRRPPTLPLARLRALGEVAQLTTVEMRFDRREIERLFRETYRHPLEPDVLDDLARTTEGWVATLRLVETAVRGRPRDEVRAVVRSLSGRHGDLHDYLAEEVVGQMPPELQGFLERCALLQVATPELAAVAAEVSPVDARRLLDDVEDAGLLSRRGRSGQAGRLLHPLVRSFLEGRLLEDVGSAGVARIHARIAAAAEAGSWWLAGHHYAAAGRSDDVARVLAGSMEAILGGGGAQTAIDLVAAGRVPDEGGWARALAARAYLRNGDYARARHAAELALAASTGGDPTISLTVALATLTTVEFDAGEHAVALGHASRLQAAGVGTIYATIAEGLIACSGAVVDESIAKAESLLLDLVAAASRLGHRHYLGITHLNLAWLGRGAGDARRALHHARLALDALADPSAGPETATLGTVAAWGYAHTGNLDAAIGAIDHALALPYAQTRFDSLLEAADVIGTYVDPDRGQDLIAEAQALGPQTESQRVCLGLFRGDSLVRLGRPVEAANILRAIPQGRYTGYPGFHVRVRVALALAAFLTGSADTSRLVADARRLAERQGADGALRALRLLEDLDRDSPAASSAVTSLWAVEPGLIVAFAEAVVARLGNLDDPAVEIVREAAARQPGRWRRALRAAVDTGPVRARWAAGTILDAVGERDDVRRLRALSRELKGAYRSPLLGRALARATADLVWVEDQGRVIVHIGDRVVTGSEMRRKPLALLCFLLSRPGMSATRDQVLDALWPDSDPDQAVNSLHQTVYFLRRVIEPAYSDDVSPGYVNQDGELVWLDPDFIGSRSVRCRDQLRGLGADPPLPAVMAVAAEYRGRFALDFTYDDWAAAHRDSLHARYLQVMERAIATATATGAVADALALARSLLEADPSLDQVEASLVKMYRLVGAHAAAAEQYQHYAAVLRDELGVEPPPLDEL